MNNTEWMADAPCKGKTNLFFSGFDKQVARAKAICATCPYSEPCQIAGREEPFGIWGGVPRRRGSPGWCDWCGKAMAPNNWIPRKRFCSKECRWKNHRQTTKNSDTPPG